MNCSGLPSPLSPRELLPKDFTVYTYNEEGKLQADYPDVQVGFHPFHALTAGDLNTE